MQEHTLVGIRIAEPGRPIVVCSCGARATGTRGSTWNVQINGDGTATINDSFDWAGHFHTAKTFTTQVLN